MREQPEYEHHSVRRQPAVLRGCPSLSLSAGPARGESAKPPPSPKAGDERSAARAAGVVSHYLSDVAVFGHVMGASTDWGAEVHHSDYEDYVRDRATGTASSTFDPYLAFDGSP